MPEYSKQIANAISAMTKRSAGAIAMLAPRAKKQLSVSEILNVRYDLCDAEGMDDENSFLWAENCGVRIGGKRD